jgi:hypothetical protein
MAEIGIKLQNEKIKVVFSNEANPDEGNLFVEFTCVRDGESKITTVGVDPSVFTRDTSFMGAMYMDMVNVLMTVKKQFDANQPYEGVHILTREEYKQYVTKVLGHKIKE